MLQDISCVHIVVGSEKHCIHVVHQLWQVIQLLVVFRPKVGKLCPTHVAQCHHLRIDM